MRRELPAALCPDPGCSEGDQIKLNDRCCTVCRGHDFCAEGHGCVENSECVNLEAGTRCVCKDGFSPMREDNAYCEDIDECAQGKHYCRENTMCVNTAGSFMCICHTGYIRIDDYSCTEHDECLSGMHNCDENALCFNMVGGHSCSCKPGYTGNGTVCKAMCDGLCQNGGTCVSPNNCICQQGFTGRRCETGKSVLFYSPLNPSAIESVSAGRVHVRGPTGVHSTVSNDPPLPSSEGLSKTADVNCSGSIRSGLVRDSSCPYMVCFLRLLALNTLLLDYLILLYPDRRHSSRFETGRRRLSLFSHSG
ncbi:protein kinase C-binding protein NELL2-like [Gadus chalcogrammus]|uniref:protein kinase C-binding protein NELL2-like n=1 Tax=Gadus chalcogrammus TaxID=1042646 RepID=UPI0024C4760B|nr:protein kinase C-binding protein NELL2-like [Gadus chalcogrammus]